jgi:hypothetical protein
MRYAHDWIMTVYLLARAITDQPYCAAAEAERLEVAKRKLLAAFDAAQAGAEEGNLLRNRTLFRGINNLQVCLG